jgi:hypothetical protein
MATPKDNTSENTEDKPIIRKDIEHESVYLSQKCKRLASALYAITRFIPANEPIRDRIRSNALSLVETTHSQATNPLGDTKPLDILKQLRDHLTVAKDGGLLSPMNYQVITEEMDGLIQKLQTTPASTGPQLNGQYFASETSQDTASRNTFASGSSNNMPAQDTGQPKESESSSKPGQSAKDKRRQKILDLFADTDEITVNDATEVIDGYSTKTIQRDLKALVDAGHLEKHGKRRWTSYTRT